MPLTQSIATVLPLGPVRDRALEGSDVRYDGKPTDNGRGRRSPPVPDRVVRRKTLPSYAGA